MKVEGEGVGVEEAVEVALEFLNFFLLFLALASRFYPLYPLVFLQKNQ